MNMDRSTTDEKLHAILAKNRGDIRGFFNAVFGYLHRRTDFFLISELNGGQLGIQRGEAEKYVQDAFLKYQQMAASQAPNRVMSDSGVATDHEITIDNEVEIVSETSPAAAPPTEMSTPKVYLADSDRFNGDTVGNRSWSQDIHDLDVTIKVSSTIKQGKQVHVNVQSESLIVDVLENGEWVTAAKGIFPYSVKSCDSSWTFHPDKLTVQVLLPKAKDMWWNRMFVEDPEINLNEIQAEQPYEDLDEDTRAKVREIMHDQNQKRLGRLTIEQERRQNILKEAWNAEGSPFANTPFDPTLIISGQDTCFPEIPEQ